MKTRKPRPTIRCGVCHKEKPWEESGANMCNTCFDSRPKTLWDPVSKTYRADAGYASVGERLSPGPVKPRIEGAGNVLAFKRMWGVCLTDGCAKQAGHADGCTRG